MHVTTDYHEKQLQRALLQYKKPENANMVREALKLAGREDLIGNTPDCLVRPAFGQGGSTRYEPNKDKNGKRPAKGGKKPHTANGKGARKPQGTSTRAEGGKKTKLDRIFGEDSERIRREAARISDADRRKSTKKGGTAVSGSKGASRPAASRNAKGTPSHGSTKGKKGKR